MCFRSSSAIPRPVPFAVLTIAFDRQWLTSLANRFSRPLRFLSSRFADFRALLLELLPEAAKAGAYLIHMAVLWASRVVQELAVAGGRQRDDAQVYAHKISGIRWRGFRRIDGNGEKEGVIAVEQISLPACALQHPLGIRAKAERHFDPPIQRQERRAINARERENALVIDHRAMRAKVGLIFLSRL